MNQDLERYMAVRDLPEEERQKYRDELEKTGRLLIGSSEFRSEVVPQETQKKKAKG